MNQSARFRPVTKLEPCAICEKGDWCRRSTDGAHECHRINEPSAKGLSRVATTPMGFAVYRDPAQPVPAPMPPKLAQSNPRAYSTPEVAADAFATWKDGTVERIYQWSAEWYRARIRTGDGKQFCEITRTSAGWIQRGPPRPHPLYRQNELPSVGPILVCEGEKATDAGWSVGLACTTSGASNSASFADWAPLSDRDVVVLPDNDSPGEKYAGEVAERLAKLIPPARVKILILPGLGPAEDLHEFIHEYRDARNADEIRAEIFKLAAEAPAFAPSGSSVRVPEGWPDPQPLPDELPAVDPFDYDLLPATLREWVRDIADRIQCPPDFPAVAAMIVLAAVVGRKVGIRPKRQDDWLVVPNLWGAAIGPPSVMKTPAIQEPLRPLKRLELEAKRDFESQMAEFRVQQLVTEQRLQVGKSAVRDALKQEGGDPMSAARDALQAQEQKPVRKRLIVNDATVEKLGEILNENPNGVLIYRDELIGLLISLDREGQEGARSFYLEAWNGNGRYTYDRIGRGTIDIEAAVVSILGSIQPGRLRSYLQGAITGGEAADGLVQRFQLAVFPDIASEWANVDRWPDTDAKNRACETILALDQIDPIAAGATAPENDGDGIPYLRFSGDAQREFDDWREQLERRLRAGTEHPVMEAHLAKFRSLIPTLALLIHLAETGSGAVGLDAVERAIGWGAYLESHARRIYAAAITPDSIEAAALARRIDAGDLPGEFALRDVYRKGWIGLGTLEAVTRAATLLCELDWLVEVVEQTPGRARKRYLTNPKLQVQGLQ